MSPFFMAVLALTAILVWGLGSYFFWRIERKTKARRALETVAPVMKLADRWLAESQEKIGKFIERAEAPLSAAQHELLELRLEATRLPQGIKNLGDLRESMAFPSSPKTLSKALSGIVEMYLEAGSYRVEGPSLVHLKTPLGEMPCLEAVLGPSGPTEEAMKSLLPLMNRLDPNAASGGFLYFAEESHYRDCLGNAQWMEGLRSRRLMLLDLKGLTALLGSLRLSQDVEGLLATFEEGVKSTLVLDGRSEKMGAALSTLNSRVLKLRAVMEGSSPEGLGK